MRKAGQNAAAVTDASQATLKTLCHEDKQKVAKLIKQVGMQDGARLRALRGAARGMCPCAMQRLALKLRRTTACMQVVDLGQQNKKLKEALEQVSMRSRGA